MAGLGGLGDAVELHCVLEPFSGVLGNGALCGMAGTVYARYHCSRGNAVLFELQRKQGKGIDNPR